MWNGNAVTLLLVTLSIGEIYSVLEHPSILASGNILIVGLATTTSPVGANSRRLFISDRRWVGGGEKECLLFVYIAAYIISIYF